MVDLSQYDKWSLGKLFDYAILPKNTQEKNVREGCREAVKYNCAAFYTASYFWTPIAKEELAGTDILIGTGIDFPFGASASLVKAFEIQHAVEAGCTAVDMVMNVGAMKAKNLKLVREDMLAVRRACRAGIILKVILETCMLSDEEKVLACQIAKDVECDFVKTSTGFNKGGATVADIALMRRTVGPKMGVKAAGGVRSYEDAIAMIAAGATRLGTSSGAAIVSGQKATGAY